VASVCRVGCGFIVSVAESGFRSSLRVPFRVVVAFTFLESLAQGVCVFSFNCYRSLDANKLLLFSYLLSLFSIICWHYGGQSPRRKTFTPCALR
jgi:hypothetical protein